VHTLDDVDVGVGVGVGVGVVELNLDKQVFSYHGIMRVLS
jgi:hypothetical protein